MRTFYRIMLWMAEFDLAIAKSAPVRNPENIKKCNADVSRWELALLQREPLL